MSDDYAGEPFRSRAVLSEIAKERGYARYASADDVLAADLRMGGPGLAGWTRHYGSRGPGWVMPKHALPGSPFDAPLPQLRPDVPVPDPLEAYEHDHDEDYAGRPEALAAHLKKDHRGRRKAGPHRHVPASKYLIPPGPHGKRWDTHPSCTADKFRAAERVFLHLEGTLKLDALVSAGEVGADVPSITLWDRAGAVSWDDWPGGEPAVEYGDGFFAGFAAWEAEWEAARDAQADELGAFLRATRVAAPVVVVCDSDWRWNPAVATEAFSLRDAVRRLGLPCVVAAPPARRGRKVGSDDFLARGNAVDDLRVVEPVESPGFADFARDYAQAQGRGIAWGRRVDADLELLRWYATHAVAEGHVARKVGTVARRLDVSRKTVRRATLRLEVANALRIVGPYASPEDDGRPNGDEVVRRPRSSVATLLVAEELRPRVRLRRLGSWLRAQG